VGHSKVLIGSVNTRQRW